MFAHFEPTHISSKKIDKWPYVFCAAARPAFWRARRGVSFRTQSYNKKSGKILQNFTYVPRQGVAIKTRPCSHILNRPTCHQIILKNLEKSSHKFCAPARPAFSRARRRGVAFRRRPSSAPAPSTCRQSRPARPGSCASNSPTVHRIIGQSDNLTIWHSDNRTKLVHELGQRVRGLLRVKLADCAQNNRTNGQSDKRAIGKSENRKIGQSDKRTKRPSDN
jgi:hypothetical protein